MTDVEPLFDVVIYEIATGKIDAVIGTRMRGYSGGRGHNTAELRQQTGRERINDRFECAIVPARRFKKGDVLPDEHKEAA